MDQINTFRCEFCLEESEDEWNFIKVQCGHNMCKDCDKYNEYKKLKCRKCKKFIERKMFLN